jgi:hypothetical protein
MNTRTLALPLLIITSLTLSACGSSDEATQAKIDEAATEERMIVTVTNISSEPLSPGVFITHDKANPFEIEGTLTDAAWEPFAETGQTDQLERAMQSDSNVSTVFAMPVGLAPGESYSFQEVSDAKYLSGAMMPVRSNDGLSLVLEADFTSGVADQSMTYDNGTEENGALDSEDDDAATAPQEKVEAHEQFTEALFKIEIKARDY